MNCLKFGVLRLDNRISFDGTFEAEWKEMCFSNIAVRKMAEGFVLRLGLLRYITMQGVSACGI